MTEDGGAATRVAILGEPEEFVVEIAEWIARHAPDLRVEVAVTTWPELVQSAAFPTDVVVLEIEPSGPVSIEARVRTCRAAGAVVVANGGDDAQRQRAIDLGAVAFWLRSDSAELLVETIRTIARDSDAREAWRRKLADPSMQRPKLSAGEMQALKLYATGLSTIEVGREMNVQYETAKTYLRRVREKYAKVGRPASKKIDLVRRATEDGILEP